MALLCSLALASALAGCGDDGRITPDAGTPDGAMEDVPAVDTPVVGTGLRGSGELTFAPVYSAGIAQNPQTGAMRPWVPVDLDEGTDGKLWVIHRMNRLAEFTDETECGSRNGQNADPNDDDCFGIQGSTAAISGPEVANELTPESAEVNFVVDRNSFHFMRRPAGIAFGTSELALTADDPGNFNRGGEQIFSSDQVFSDIFATCSDHITGNLTDQPPFNGPSLWTGDPAIYQTGTMPSYAGANGTHLDMVHATQLCVGIAWEREQVYWVLNGAEGALDRYDFGAPHAPGNYYHEDASVARYIWDGIEFGRVEDVPSNMEIDADTVYIADTGHGRIVTMSITGAPAPTNNFSTYEGIRGDVILNPPLLDLVDNGALTAAWGAEARPSGLALLDEQTVVIADHASGNISVLDRATGEIVRTVDTGLGMGIGGLTVMGGAVYFTHMETRKVYRIDVAE